MKIGITYQQLFHYYRMKALFLLMLLLLSVTFSFGQAERKGTKKIYFSIGPNFSNFLNSEAPHKINIYGSDKFPALVAFDVTQSAGYFDYNTSFIKDAKMGLSIHFALEYFLKNDLSLVGEIGFEQKGIHLESYKGKSWMTPDMSDLGANAMPSTLAYYDEIFKVNIKNEYLTMAFLCRKYISKQRFYVQGGIFIGWLTKSDTHVFLRKHTYTPEYAGYESDMTTIIDGQDDKRELTTNLDFGLSIGTGYCYPITNKLSFNANLLLNMGLRKIDKKYNNEYEERTLPYYTGYGTLLRSTNYFGLNSNATNITAAFGLGLSYAL